MYVYLNVVCLYMPYVSRDIYTYTCMYTYIYIYVYTYTFLSLETYIHKCISIYVSRDIRHVQTDYMT